MRQDLGNRELQILAATLAFITQTNPTLRNSGAFFIAQNLRDFIQDTCDISSLSIEGVARTLNRNRVIKEVWRPHMELTNKKGVKEQVQKSCYRFDKEMLTKLTKEL